MFKNATQGYFVLHWAHLYRFDPGINLIKRGRRTLLKFDDEHLGQDFIAGKSIFSPLIKLIF